MAKKSVTIDDLAVMVNTGFSAMEKRFTSIDNRFTGVDRRFDGVDRRLDVLETDMREVKTQSILCIEMNSMI